VPLKLNLSYIKTSINLCFQVLQYNVPGGKKNRGLAVVYAYRMLAAKEELNPENVRLSQIMGWCVEMVREKCDYLFNFADCLHGLGNN
jgi:geranylgeranyl pyrophosphate synthase